MEIVKHLSQKFKNLKKSAMALMMAGTLGVTGGCAENNKTETGSQNVIEEEVQKDCNQNETVEIAQDWKASIRLDLNNNNKSVEMDYNKASEESEFLYMLKEGATYYESSDEIGKSATVDENNPYTSVPCNVAINGWSYLNNNGEIIEAKYDESTNNIEVPKLTLQDENADIQQLMLHVYGEDYRLGWVRAEDVLNFNKVQEEQFSNTGYEETQKDTNNTSIEDVQTPEDVVDSIYNVVQDAKATNQKVAILIDTSGSVYDKREKIYEGLKKVDLNQGNTIILKFASNVKNVEPDTFSEQDIDFGGMTELYSALNKANEQCADKIIVITDLVQNGYVSLNETENAGELIVYDTSEEWSDEQVLNEITSKYPNMKIIHTVIGKEQQEIDDEEERG